MVLRLEQDKEKSERGRANVSSFRGENRDS